MDFSPTCILQETRQKSAIGAISGRNNDSFLQVYTFKMREPQPQILICNLALVYLSVGLSLWLTALLTGQLTDRPLWY